MESNFKVQNPSDLCLVLVLRVGGIYLSGEENKCSVFQEENQTGADAVSENSPQIKVPQKGHQNNLLKKEEKGKDRKHIVLIFRMQQQS